MEQLFKLDQQGISKGLVFLIRQRDQKLDITNQMGQAKLLELVSIFDIGTEEIAHNRAPIGFSQDFFKDFRRTRLGDPEKTDQGRAKNPSPIFDAFIFPAGFINVQKRLGGYMFLELFTRRGQGFIDPLNHVAQMTARNMDIQNDATKGLQTAIRSMERTFQVADQCLQPGSEQLSFDDTIRKFGPNHLATARADIAVQTIFCDNQRVFTKLRKLVNTHLVQCFASAPASTLTYLSVKFLCVVNLFTGERLTNNAGMTWLATLVTSFLRFLALGRLDNIRGRWFGGVLREFCDLLGKLDDLCFKLSNLFLQGRVLSLQLSDPLLISFFTGRFHRPLLILMPIMISDSRGPPVKKMFLTAARKQIQSKNWYLMSGCVVQRTEKSDANGLNGHRKRIGKKACVNGRPALKAADIFHLFPAF